jgi:hypothetical protein
MFNPPFSVEAALISRYSSRRKSVEKLSHVHGCAVIAGIMTAGNDQAVTDFDLIGAVSGGSSMPFRSILLAVKSATLNWPDSHYSRRIPELRA